VPDGVRLGCRQLLRHDGVRLLADHRSADRGGVRTLRAQDVDQLGGDVGAAILGDHRGRRPQQVAVRGRREDDGPTAVVDAAPLRGLDDHALELVARHPHEPVALADLPVREPPDECAGDEAEDGDDRDQPQPAVGPRQHR
jgi:hypothetical protein